jgi:hypothetical protein
MPKEDLPISFDVADVDTQKLLAISMRTGALPENGDELHITYKKLTDPDKYHPHYTVYELKTKVIYKTQSFAVMEMDEYGHIRAQECDKESGDVKDYTIFVKVLEKNLKF